MSKISAASRARLKSLIIWALFIVVNFGAFSFSRSDYYDTDDEEITASGKEQAYRAMKQNVRHKNVEEPKELAFFRRAYPFVTFVCDFDESLSDWKIDIRADDGSSKPRHGELYWCECRFLPRDKITQKSLYRAMLYHYPRTTPDPKSFSEADGQKILSVTNDEARSRAPIDPPFLYDIIYDTGSKESTESHVKRLALFDRYVNAHEYLRSKLEVITERLKKKAMGDPAVEEFLKTLAKTDGYNWRSVRDTTNRSFHSIGLAIDILPRGYNKKTTYWLWRREMVGDKWFLTPLEDRWAPPPAVIKTFESMGFVWGGKWVIWDDMHFEYHPEVLLYNGM